jgi:SNF2 family DNA or RNA helicase
MSTDKDKVLETLKKLEEERVDLLKSQQRTKDEIAKKKPEVETLSLAYEEIKSRFEKAQQELRQKSKDLNSIQRMEQDNKLRIESARRELGRLLDTERIDAEYQRQVEAFREGSLGAPWREENRNDGIGIFPYQVEGAFHLAATREALLGDSRGLGKTLTALAAVDMLDAERVIFLSPPDLAGNIIREIKLWTPHRNAWTLADMTREQRDFMMSVIKTQGQYVLTIPYTTWRKDSEIVDELISLKADALILDEAHHAKTWNTVTAKGVRKLRFGPNYCPGGEHDPILEYYGRNDTRAKCIICGYDGSIAEFSTFKYVVPMTGSFIMNRPQELFPHLHLVHPTGFPDEKSFLQDFCRMNIATNRWEWSFGGEERVLKKIGPRYLARTREDAGVEVPPAQLIDHKIPFEEMANSYPKQHAAYLQGREYAQLILDPDNDVVMNLDGGFVVLMRLRQILVWPAGVELKIKEKVGEDAYVERVIGNLQVEESIKLDYAERDLIQYHEEGDRSVLFSMFRPGLHILKKRLIKKGLRVGLYDGSTPRFEKRNIELDFDPKTAPDKPKYDILLANYKSAGEGLNFNTANHEILLDRYWNFAGEDQAAGRIDRIGTTEAGIVDKMMVTDSVDTWMADLIEEKKSLIDSFDSQAALFRKAYDDILKGKL